MIFDAMHDILHFMIYEATYDTCNVRFVKSFSIYKMIFDF